MDAKELAAIQKPVIDLIEKKLFTRLNALALLEMVREFYTKEERESLMGEYRQLAEADAAAYSQLRDITPASVALGVEDAERAAMHRAAMDAKSKTYNEVVAFEKKHPLLIRLLDAKETLGKSRHEE